MVDTKQKHVAVADPEDPEYFVCPNCGHGFYVPDWSSGDAVRCDRCNNVIVIIGDD